MTVQLTNDKTITIAPTIGDEKFSLIVHEDGTWESPHSQDLCVGLIVGVMSGMTIGVVHEQVINTMQRALHCVRHHPRTGQQTTSSELN